MPLGTLLGVPHGVLFERFLAHFEAQDCQKHSKSTLWGTPRQVPEIAQKALRGALSGPGLSKSTLWGIRSQVPKSTQKALLGALLPRPLGTPVNGGRDRNHTSTDFLRGWWTGKVPEIPRKYPQEGPARHLDASRQKIDSPISRSNF